MTAGQHRLAIPSNPECSVAQVGRIHYPGYLDEAFLS
jgi:hypothetical protein